MASLPKEIQEFMSKWNVAQAEVWPVPGGKSYAVKHSALERIAAEAGIIFGPPNIIEAHGDSKIYSLWMDARLGDRVEWSTGEAAPANNKNSYPLAMAEKRAKDRCTLKLLAIHGLLYSEDEFRGDEEAPRASSYSVKKNSPDAWPALEKAVRAATTRDELTVLWKEWKPQFTAWPQSWQEQVDELFVVRAEELFGREAAE